MFVLGPGQRVNGFLRDVLRNKCFTKSAQTIYHRAKFAARLASTYKGRFGGHGSGGTKIIIILESPKNINGVAFSGISSYQFWHGSKR